MRGWILITRVLVHAFPWDPRASPSPPPHRSRWATVSVQADYKTQHSSGGGGSRVRTHPPGRQPQGDGVGPAALVVRASRALMPTRHSLTDSTASSRPRAAAPEQTASDATERCQPRQRRHTSGERTDLQPSHPDASLPRVPPRDVTASPVSTWADGGPQGSCSGLLAPVAALPSIWRTLETPA